jgi:LysM repeat protein
MAHMRAAHLGWLAGLAALWFAPDAVAKPKASCEYTVVSGDTTSGIAAKHGLAQRRLVELNRALHADKDKLKLGQVLTVCDDVDDADIDADADADAAAATKKKKPRDDADDDGKTKADDTGPIVKCGAGGRIVKHIVSSGDTLAQIALEYDVSERDIRNRNAALAADPNKLKLGQRLSICVVPEKLELGGKTKPGKAPKIVKAKECGMETPLFLHEVVPGEHLGQIAGRYGVRKADLLRLNPSIRSNPDMLSVGKKVRVCPEIAPRERTRSAHTVVKGETLGSIALRYGLSPKELERFQRGKLEDANALREGQSLVVWVDGRIVAGFGARDVDTGVLKSGIQLAPGKNYVVKWEAGAWGTSKTITAIQQAASEYRRRSPSGPKVHVGDISKRGGGKFPPHLSHQHGRDVDVGYVLTGKDAHETKFRHANAKNLDVPRTWALVKAFIDTDEVTYIFMDHRIQKLLYEYAESKGVDEDTLDELFQYPRGRGRSHGIIRHWKGHANHFHVRFRP